MNSEYVLMEYYARYLRDIKKLSETSVKHYIGANKYISRYLVKKNRIKASIYEIRDIDELEIIREYLYNEPDFIELDERGHRMYSAGFNNYYKFAMGEGFHDINHDIQIMDIEVPVGEVLITENRTWKRSTIIKQQTIQSANYQCEINHNHSTFIAKSTGHQYMEGHHAIPMNKQGRFDKSLDVYANIVCLCPVCHRLLHYGIEIEKRTLLQQIYDGRAERLAASGIRLSKDEFMDMAV